MKTFVCVLLVAACFVACTQGFPGVPRYTSDSDESDESGEKKNVDTLLVLPSQGKNHFGVPAIDLRDMGDLDDSFEDFAAPSWSFNPFRSNPLNGFMTRMQDVMRKFTEQMAGILHSQVPDQGDISWSKIPEGANTTSTVKVIDGHTVVINETTYREGDDQNGVLFRIRILDVKPSENWTNLLTESEASAEVTTLPTVASSGTAATEDDSTTSLRSVETVEDFNNEIPKDQVDPLTA